MKTALATLFLMLATPAMAGQCFHAVAEPTATLTEADDGLVWSDGSKIVHMSVTTGNSGVIPRLAFEPNGGIFQFEYSDGKLIFNQDVYEPGCE